jgi:hypothetical protein
MPAPFGSEARLRIFEAQPSGCAERIFPGKPSPWDLSGRFPVRPSVLRANRGVGRAPHARKGRHCANPNVFSFRPPAFRAPARNHDMPWFELGRSLRTRRAHPSEKTPFASSPGFSRKAVSHWLTLSEGRAPGRILAPHARKDPREHPQGRLTVPANASRRGGLRTPTSFIGPPLPPRLPPMLIGKPWQHPGNALPVRPSRAGAETASLRENRLSRHLRLSPLGHPGSGGQSRGGAGSARP